MVSLFTKSKHLLINQFIDISENGLPPANISFSIDIDNTKPLIRKAGEMVRFVVGVHSFPDFESVQSLLWFKNDVLIDKNHRHYNTNLKTDGPVPQSYLQINHITVEDSGTYMLVSHHTISFPFA